MKIEQFTQLYPHEYIKTLLLFIDKMLNSKPLLEHVFKVSEFERYLITSVKKILNHCIESNYINLELMTQHEFASFVNGVNLIEINYSRLSQLL